MNDDVNNNENTANPRQKTKSYITKRFYISFAWALAAFILIIIGTTPRDQWVSGFIGSVIFALLSGVMAMAIPTRQKIIFVPVSLVICFIIAVTIGKLVDT